MKLNKFFLSILGLTTVLLSSCKESDDYTAGTWDAAANYGDVFFMTSSKTVELDPAAATTGSFEIFRRNRSGELKVTCKVVENTNDVFTVDPIVFADGDSVATVNVSFPAAEVGTTYKLKLKLDDPAYVSQYTDGVTFTYAVTRVKWNLLGKGTLAENFYMGGVGNVEIYQKDSDPNMFRIMHPFDEIIEALKADTESWAPEEFNGKQPEYFELTVNKGIVTYPSYQTGIYSLNYSADIWIHHPKAFTSLADPSNWTYNKVLGYQEGNNLPGQIQMAPYYYMDGVGGWNKTQSDGIIVITFPGYTPKYTASLENGDFKWEKVYTGTFMSEQFGENHSKVALYKGVEIPEVKDANEGCYERFYEQNGVPYLIAGPYADGANIVFCAKDSKIIVPEGFESQALGLKQMGYDIFATINAADSKFSDERVDLNITFTDESGDHKLGTATESLLNITYTKDMVLGNFTYYGVIDGEEENLGNFSIVEHPTAADSLIVNDLYQTGTEVRAAYDLDAATFSLEAFSFVGIEEVSGTQYYIFTYSLAGEDWISFDINMDGTLSTQDMILVATPDMSTLYYWANTSDTRFVPYDGEASARKASGLKSLKGKKGAKLNVKLPAKAKAQIHK